MVALLLAALDQTIVATALPKVVSDLGGITQYSWVFTAYMLGSTVTVPLYGKLGDAHGRKPLFLVAITIFLAGSALCGAAQNMVQLVIFRAIQGVGAGGLFPLTLAMVGMIVPPRDRGRYQGLIGSVFAAASISGPLVGGFIVDSFSWRWICYVNLPVGGLALAVILVTMPRRTYKQEHSIDWFGAGVLAAGTTALLLGLVWGGGDYPRASPQGLGALGGALVLLVAFALVEREVREPILPFELLRHQTVASSVAGIGLGMMMQIFVLSVQNSVPRRSMGTATALTQFSRSIGATLGVTLMGVIVNQQLPAGVRGEGTAIHRLPAAGRVALANALHPAFLAAAGLCVLVFVISLLWVREQPLKRGVEDEPIYGDESSPQPGTAAAEGRSAKGAHRTSCRSKPGITSSSGSAMPS